MSLLTLEALRYVMPQARALADRFMVPLDTTCDEFDISTPERVAAFVAQIAHESGELHYVRELATGQEYEGRTDLGNTQPGDGIRFKGRGLIQLTGRLNYARAGAALILPLVDHPELLEEPVNASRVSGWFWKTHGLNELADAYDFVRITRIINGGTNGLAQRQQYYERAKSALGLQ